MTFGAIFGAQSDATGFVGCVSLIPQILSFWLRPGVEIRRGQAVSGNFISGIWLWGTCKGRLGEPDGELSLSPPGEPGGATIWSLHINKKSKNPFKLKLS